MVECNGDGRRSAVHGGAQQGRAVRRGVHLRRADDGRSTSLLSCPAITPKRGEHVVFYPTAAAASSRPGSARASAAVPTPRSARPEWNVRSDVAGRAGAGDRGRRGGTDPGWAGWPARPATARARQVGLLLDKRRSARGRASAGQGAGGRGTARVLVETSNAAAGRHRLRGGVRHRSGSSTRRCLRCTDIAPRHSPGTAAARDRAPRVLAGGGLPRWCVLRVAVGRRFSGIGALVTGGHVSCGCGCRSGRRSTWGGCSGFLAARGLFPGWRWPLPDLYAWTISSPHGSGVLSLRPCPRCELGGVLACAV